MSHPYSIEINEPEEREERDEFDNSDEERDIKREREEEQREIDDRNLLARLIRAEFDRIHKEAHNFDAFDELIRVAERFGFKEMAREMRNDSLHSPTP